MGIALTHLPRDLRRRIHRSTIAAILLTAGALAPLAGCLTIDVNNPSFATTPEEVWAEWRRLRAQPTTLARPVVILNGYRGSHLRGLNLASDLAKLTSQDRDDFLVLSYPLASDIPSVARRITQAVQQRWPSQDPARTIDVDVVGFSMGGLVARYAALPTDQSAQDRRLAIHHLYTLATPHRGARAAILGVDRAVQQMMPGSLLLSTLDEHLAHADYPIVAYTQTNDAITGPENASPPGADPIWTGGTTMFSHFTITTNRRILVDIAKRLREEAALASPSPVEAR